MFTVRVKGSGFRVHRALRAYRVYGAYRAYYEESKDLWGRGVWILLLGPVPGVQSLQNSTPSDAKDYECKLQTLNPKP